MAENLSVQAPDFERIRRSDMVATADGIRLLWLVLNDEIARRRRSRSIWKDEDHANLTFSASAGTWTVGSSDFQYMRYAHNQEVLTISFSLIDTTTSAGMGTELYISMPEGLSHTGVGSGSGLLHTTLLPQEIVWIDADPNDNSRLRVIRNTGLAWPSALTNDLDLKGTVVVQHI